LVLHVALALVNAGDPGHHIIEWYQRSRPSDASMSYSPRENPQKGGISIEAIAKYATVLGQDVWINVPIGASTACMPVPQGDSCWSGNSSSYVS